MTNINLCIVVWCAWPFNAKSVSIRWKELRWIEGFDVIPAMTAATRKDARTTRSTMTLEFRKSALFMKFKWNSFYFDIISYDFFSHQKKGHRTPKKKGWWKFFYGFTSVSVWEKNRAVLVSSVLLLLKVFFAHRVAIYCPAGCTEQKGVSEFREKKKQGTAATRPENVWKPPMAKRGGPRSSAFI